MDELIYDGADFDIIKSKKDFILQCSYTGQQVLVREKDDALELAKLINLLSEKDTENG